MLLRLMKGTCLAFGLLAVLLPGPTRAADEEKEGPILALVRGRLKDPDRPFTLVIRLKVKEGAGKRLEAAFAKAAQATRKEKGNQAYALNRDTGDPSRYLVYERWKDLAALRAHLKAPYIKALLAELAELTDGAPQSQVFLPVGE